MSRSTNRLTILIVCIILAAIALSGCSDAAGNGEANSENPNAGAIIINEVMASNGTVLPAADGRYYDWVELHNLTGSAYDLSNCYLTDDEQTPRKCKLRDIVIEPYGYVVIYLSGLNGIDVDGYLHTGFKLSSLGETLILNDADGDVMSMINVPASPDNVSYGYSAGSADYGADSGVWFAHSTPGAQNSDVYSDSHSNLVFAGNGVVINEYMTDNSFVIYDADADYSDWVELYNPTGTDADMTGYLLSDNLDSPGKWGFPDGTVIPAGGYLLVFCSGKDYTDAQGYLHTSFALSREDTAIILSGPQGLAVSQTAVEQLPENISCGCPEGSSEWKLFARPTPGAANTTVSFELASRPNPDINEGVYISETLASSSGSSEYATDFVEIHNSTSVAVNLGGYTLSQSPDEVAFTFPDVTLGAGEYLLVYCDGTAAEQSGAEFHAPFKINVGGEAVYLANSDGRIVDCFNTGKQIFGVSSGRRGNDISVRFFFTTPTPGSANDGKWYASYAPQPSFSQAGGYTASGTQVYINVPEGCVIRYTTNGFEPDENSKTYSEGTAIVIDRTTVLKAVSFRDGSLPSQAASATYFVEDPHSIAVVSMSGFGLIDDKYGIMVKGNNNNYMQGWVREVHIEYYDPSGNLGVEFDAGAQIFGMASRSLKKKGVRLSINEKYGASEVTYPFFPDSVSGVSTFQSLLLRPSGQDQSYAMLRDEIVPALIRGQVEIDYQEYQACALYINGEYWGLYYIRERLDEDYIVSKYGYEKGKIDLIKFQFYAQSGSCDAYYEMENFAKENDLTIQENYEHMASLVDFESLCDFWIVETYLSNTDTGNIRCYCAEGGKWRWMTYDYDWSMFPSTYHRDYIYAHCLEENGHGVADYDNSIIRKLLQNDEFRDLFISRYCYHLNNTFSTERCLGILEGMIDVIQGEVSRNINRWNYPKQATWEEHCDFLREFFTVKPEMAKQQLMKNFDLSEKELNKYLEENR